MRDNKLVASRAGWYIMEELQMIVPVQQANVNVEAQFVEIMVPLYSYGCANKIKKALAHFKGSNSIH